MNCIRITNKASFIVESHFIVTNVQLYGYSVTGYSCKVIKMLFYIPIMYHFYVYRD